MSIQVLTKSCATSFEVFGVGDGRWKLDQARGVKLQATSSFAGNLKARSSGFVTCYALDESGVCEGRPAGQREMRQMAQCLRELGFVQERNATKDPLLGRTRKWHWPGTGDTGAAR